MYLNEAEEFPRAASTLNTLTLLFGPRLNTTSECTFRVFNLPAIQSFTARKIAVKMCVVEIRVVASMKA